MKEIFEILNGRLRYLDRLTDCILDALKQAGKQAIHLDDTTQLFFGIKGK